MRHWAASALVVGLPRSLGLSRSDDDEDAQETGEIEGAQDDIHLSLMSKARRATSEPDDTTNMAAWCFFAPRTDACFLLSWVTLAYRGAL